MPEFPLEIRRVIDGRGDLQPDDLCETQAQTLCCFLDGLRAHPQLRGDLGATASMRVLQECRGPSQFVERVRTLILTRKTPC